MMTKEEHNIGSIPRNMIGQGLNMRLMQLEKVKEVRQCLIEMLQSE